MNEKIDQRLKITLRQLEVFAAVTRGGSTRAAADTISRSQSAASHALSELEDVLGVRLFDRIGKRLVINENGRALMPRAAALLDQAEAVESLFSSHHRTALRLVSSYTIGEYLLPEIIARWKSDNPQSHVVLEIVNTHDVFERLTSFRADIGFIEGTHSHPELTVRKWRSDEIVVVAAAGHPWVQRRTGVRQLSRAAWVLREPGSGTREASDRWLIPNLASMDVALELGSNEAVKRVVASGLGLGCLSRLAVGEAIAQGWLVELMTTLPPMPRTLSTVVHRARQLGSGAEQFLRHCTG